MKANSVFVPIDCHLDVSAATSPFPFYFFVPLSQTKRGSRLKVGAKILSVDIKTSLK